MSVVRSRSEAGPKPEASGPARRSFSEGGWGKHLRVFARVRCGQDPLWQPDLFSYRWSTMNVAIHDRFQKVTSPTNYSGGTRTAGGGESIHLSECL